ncbi:MAG: GTPase [Actinomycetota bacterium]
MTDVVDIVDGLDLVVGLAEGHLHPDDLDSARRAARNARDRVGHLGASLVTALLGGTGVGKSSLLNALAGEPVASTSPVRPHTTEPLAWIPSNAEPALSTLLKDLGITRRVLQTRVPGIAILDMTDIDSLEAGHRRWVESVLPVVDVGVWVLDPLKYAEVAMHRDFITPLAGAASRMVFVLNQIDRVPADERGIMRAHLIELLQLDGIARPVIFEVAADPPIGPRIGIDALFAHLTSRLDEKKVHLGRVVEEARAAARKVAAATGVGVGGSIGFEERWDEVRSAVVNSLSASGSTIAGLEEALRSVEHLVGAISAAAGGAFGLRTRQVFNPDRVEEQVRAAVDAMEQAVPRTAGRSAEADRRSRAAVVLDAELQERIGAPLRTLLWERASLSAVVAGLAVDAAMAEARLGIGISDQDGDS